MAETDRLLRRMLILLCLYEGLLVCEMHTMPIIQPVYSSFDHQ